MAASDAGCENIWLRRLLGEFTDIAATRINGLLVPKDFEAPKMPQKFYDNEVPTMFHEDNLGCLKCSEDPVLSGRMKHSTPLTWVLRFQNLNASKSTLMCLRLPCVMSKAPAVQYAICHW